MLFVAPAVHAQAAPPTLTGESLTGTNTITSASCNPDGTSTFSYSASGAAAGPYVGTFTETGTVTVGPQPIPPGTFSAPGGTVMSWDATFTITSAAPAATITGTKTLLPPPPGTTADVHGVCEPGTRPNFPPQYAANALNGNSLLGYTATITLADGSQYRDSGTSRANLEWDAGGAIATFVENYASSQAATIPLCDENSQTDQDQDADDQGCANP